MDYRFDPTVCCIKGCDKKVEALGLCINHWRRNRKYGSPVARKNHSGMFRGLSPAERFSMQMDKTESCWFWITGKDQDGYGSFKGEVDGVVHSRAHRFSYALHKGPIPNGLLVCHTCDTPACVNPDHLFLGTSDDNMKDKIAKGRSRVAFGEAAGKAKLTEKQIVEILQDPRPYTAIASDYGVKSSTIGSIKQRVSWSHLDVPVVKHKQVSPMKGRSKKITPEIVLAIRASSDKLAVLASRYGVSPQTICDIQKYRSWAHVEKEVKE